MTESELYQRVVKQEFSRKGYFHFRVEHPRLPDLYTSHRPDAKMVDGMGEVLWIEFKVVEKRSKDGIIRPKWRPGQLAWIKDHEEKGGKNILLCLWYIDKVYYLNPQKEYTEEDLKITYAIGF